MHVMVVKKLFKMLELCISTTNINSVGRFKMFLKNTPKLCTSNSNGRELDLQ